MVTCFFHTRHSCIRFGAQGPGHASSSRRAPSFLWVHTARACAYSLVHHEVLRYVHSDYRGSAAGREAKGFTMDNSEMVKAAFSRMKGAAAYAGAAQLSTVDARKALLLCAIFVAKRLDFTINDTGSRGNEFKYFSSVACLFRKDPGYDDQEPWRKLWLESSLPDAKECRHQSYRNAVALLNGTFSAHWRCSDPHSCTLAYHNPVADSTSEHRFDPSLT